MPVFGITPLIASAVTTGFQVDSANKQSDALKKQRRQEQLQQSKLLSQNEFDTRKTKQQERAKLASQELDIDMSEKFSNYIAAQEGKSSIGSSKRGKTLLGG